VLAGSLLDTTFAERAAIADEKRRRALLLNTMGRAYRGPEAE